MCTIWYNLPNRPGRLNHSNSSFGIPFWSINKHFILPICILHWHRNFADSSFKKYFIIVVFLLFAILANTSWKSYNLKRWPNWINGVFKQILFSTKRPYFSNDPVSLLPFPRCCKVCLIVVNHWGKKCLRTVRCHCSCRGWEIQAAFPSIRKDLGLFWCILHS